MSTKRKGAEEQLIERNRDLDRLKARVEQLEKEVAAYRAKEAEITSAMTLAAQSRANIIAEAEKVAGAMTHNAEKEAKAITDNAHAQAQHIVREAQNQASLIMDKAKTDADELTKQTEKTTKEIVSVTFESTKKMREHTDAINDTLVRAAADLYRYIIAYRDDYEGVTGKKLEGIAQLEAEEKKTPVQPVKEETQTPDDYNTPEELYHTVLKLSGRDPESKIPDTVPLSDDMLDLGNTEENIAGIINTGNTQDMPSQQDNQEAEKPTEQKEEQKSAEEDAQEEANEQQDLEAVLNEFMSSIEAPEAERETAAEEKTEDTQDDDIDNILGTITEEDNEAAPLTSESDELTKILNELFGEEKKSSM